MTQYGFGKFVLDPDRQEVRTDDRPVGLPRKNFEVLQTLVLAEGRLISRDWGTCAENVASWISTRANQHGFLLLRYEDMMHDTPKELARVAERLTAAEREAAERDAAGRSGGK